MLALVSQKHNVFFLDFGMYSKVKRTDIHLQRYVGVGVFGNYRGVFCFLPTMGVRFLQDSQVKPARTTFFFFFQNFTFILRGSLSPPLSPSLSSCVISGVSAAAAPLLPLWDYSC